MLAALRIIALCILAAIAYGIVHDQITARLCVEYFTVGHPPVFPTTDPTLLAFGWGVIATWWVGLILGVPLALCCRAGSWPKVSATQLVHPVLILLGTMAIFAALAGVAGNLAARAELIRITDPWLLERLPPDRRVPFIVDACTHLMSYAAGFVGGLVLCALTLLKRWRTPLAETAST